MRVCVTAATFMKPINHLASLIDHLTCMDEPSTEGAHSPSRSLDSQAEVGYLNGHVVALGIFGDTNNYVVSLTPFIHASIR